MTFRIQKSWRWLVAGAAVFVPGIVSGALALPFTFSTGTAIKAADVNANFEALRARLDAISAPGSALPPVIGSITMTGVLSAAPIRKFSQSLTVAASQVGTGAGSAEPVFSNIQITRDLGTGSAAVINAFNQGKVQTVSIVMGNLTIKLGGAFILGVKSATALAGHPQEVMDLTFTTIEWDYAAPAQPTVAVTYDRARRVGGTNPRTAVKYAAPASGSAVPTGFLAMTGFTQGSSCTGAPVGTGTGGGCSGKASFGPASLQKPMGATVTDDFGRAVISGVYPTVDLQVFSDATTVSNEMRLTNATLSSLSLTSNDDGSLSESMDFDWQKADWLFGNTIASFDRLANK